MSDLLERLRDMAAGKSDDLDIAAEAIEEIIDLNWRVVLIEEERDKLRAQIAAHEKVCAGVWVKVTERLPENHTEVAIIDSVGITGGHVMSSGRWHYTHGGGCASLTHWLDARMPGGEG